MVPYIRTPSAVHNEKLNVPTEHVLCRPLKLVQPTPLERTVFLRRLQTTHINFWRKERPKYPEQSVTGVPKVIEQILLFGKGKHLPRDEESVIIQDGLDGLAFPEGGSEAPTLQPKMDRLRREKREREAKKQAKHAQQVLEKRQHTLDAFCVAAPLRADVASSSSSLPQPSQSSQPPMATQSQPQSDSNRKGKERAPSSQPKPPAKKTKKRKQPDEPRTCTEEEVAKMNKQTEDKILEMLLHVHEKSTGAHPLDPQKGGVCLRKKKKRNKSSRGSKSSCPYFSQNSSAEWASIPI